MTLQEFNDQFDVMYNNITSNQAPGLDLYEKSVFLTNAQEDIIRSYFSNRLNKSGKGFDREERRQIDFSSLVVTTTINNFSNDSILSKHSNSKIVDLPKDVLLVLNEALDVRRNNKVFTLSILPIYYMEYDRLNSKAFRRPTKNQAWRIITNGTSKVELVTNPGDVMNTYTLRYIRKPKPIILENIEDQDLSIDGISIKTECELDPSIHRDILQRAVELAKATYTGGLQDQLVLGNTSKTNIGLVSQ